MNPPAYRLAYHQALVYKIFNACKPDKILVNFAQSLDYIRQLHRLTRGMPQIVYLAGWQYDGHDSRYPDWFEVNRRLAPPGADARQSLIDLMHQALRYNAVVSLHINMDDAYENAPSWPEYLRRDVLMRTPDGALRKGGIWDGEQSYRISKTREWRAGLAQQRIDRLLEFLPIAEAGTVHIDTFSPGPSVYHGITWDDEVATMLAILGYWRDHGIDVTGEFFMPELAGWLPMVYHYNADEANRLKYPPTVICGGGPAWNQRWARLRNWESITWPGGFSAPGGGCKYEEAWGISVDRDVQPGAWADFVREVYLRTIPWHFLNTKTALEHVHREDVYQVRFSDDVVTSVRTADRHLNIRQSERLLLDGTDLCMPALWRSQECIAFSQTGGTRQWQLSSEWIQEHEAALIPLTEPGETQRIRLDRGRLNLTLKPQQAVVITRV